MIESIEDYKNRIKGYAADCDPLTLQEEMPVKLKRLLATVSPDKLDIKLADSKWSIREIVAHLADDELVGAYRIRLILNSPGTYIQAFDQARWAINGKYTITDVNASIALYTLLRQANLELFKTLSTEQWKLYGIHEERGIETIEDIMVYYAGHDINHLKQIEAILTMYQSSSTG